MEIDNTAPTPAEVKNGDFAAFITDAVNAQLPEEKARAKRELAETAEAKKGLLPDMVDGRGMAIGSIPPIIYFRWAQLYPGCWRNRQFLEEFLYDNPECAMPGYKPKAKPVYFDMGRKVKLAPGAETYHRLKGRVAADAIEIERRFRLMGLAVN